MPSSTDPANAVRAASAGGDGAANAVRGAGANRARRARHPGRPRRQPIDAWVAEEIERLRERLAAGADRDEMALGLRALAEVLEARDLGAELVAARAKGVPWKVLQRRYRLSRARLHQIWRGAACGE